VGGPARPIGARRRSSLCTRSHCAQGAAAAPPASMMSPDPMPFVNAQPLRARALCAPARRGVRSPPHLLSIPHRLLFRRFPRAPGRRATHLDGVRGLDVEGDGLARQGLDEDLHPGRSCNGRARGGGKGEIVRKGGTTGTTAAACGGRGRRRARAPGVGAGAGSVPCVGGAGCTHRWAAGTRRRGDVGGGKIALLVFQLG
jgi:hypothetical protein